MNIEEQILYRRTIMLDKTKSKTEREIAHKRLMELLEVKELETNGEYPGNDIINARR